MVRTLKLLHLSRCAHPINLASPKARGERQPGAPEDKDRTRENDQVGFERSAFQHQAKEGIDDQCTHDQSPKRQQQGRNRKCQVPSPKSQIPNPKGELDTEGSQGDERQAGVGRKS